MLPDECGNDYDSCRIGKQHAVSKFELACAPRQFASGENCVFGSCCQLISPEFTDVFASELIVVLRIVNDRSTFLAAQHYHVNDIGTCRSFLNATDVVFGE